MLGLVLYLVFIVLLFVLTWAGLGAILSYMKEEKAVNDEFRKELTKTFEAVITIQGALNDCLKDISANEKRSVEVINNCLNNIDARIDALNAHTIDISEVVEEQPKKKRNRKKKEAESREDLEQL